MSQSATYRPPLLRRPSAAGVNNTPGRCPFLGTPNDPGTSLAFPSEANHCFRSRFPIPISSIHQENYCLSSQYESCPVYRQYATQDEPAEIVPVAAVAMAAPEPRWTGDAGGSAIAPAAAVAASMALGSGRAPAAATYQEPIHPDFQADPGPAAAPLPARRVLDVDPRSVLLGLVLLAMVALGGWAVLTFLGGRDGRPAAGQGAVVALPTAAATVDRTVGETVSAIVVDAGGQATATALAGSVVATPTAEEIAATAAAEGVAATATALFAGAVATAECHAPDWWVLYVTQEGDTVEALAAARGILPEELIVANCLAAPELTPGLELRLPPVGVIVLLPGPTATPLPPTPTAAVIFPTRRPPLIFPTATFPVIVVPTAAPLEPEPGEPTPARPRPTAAPTQPANPTATPPIFPTLTPPLFPVTSTPPIIGTPGATKTPPGGGDVTPTATPTVGPSRTPPIP